MSNRLYCSQNTTGTDKYFELDLDTLLDITGGGVTNINTKPMGIGGTSTQLFTTDLDTGKLYELDLDTLTDISGGGVAHTGISTVYGLGCSGDRLFAVDAGSAAEFDPSTLTIIGSQATVTGASFLYGIGGTSDTLYAYDTGDGVFSTIDKDTLQFTGSPVSSPNTGFAGGGIGGTSDRLYHCNNSDDKIFEIDPITLLDISGGGVSGIADPVGIGGIKGTTGTEILATSSTSTSTSQNPSVGVGVGVQATISTSSSTSQNPVVTAPQNVNIDSTVSTSTSTALVPELNVAVNVASETATSISTSLNPKINEESTNIATFSQSTSGLSIGLGLKL